MKAKCVGRAVILVVLLALLASVPVLADAGIPKEENPKRTYGDIQNQKAMEAMDQVHVPVVSRPILRDLRIVDEFYWEIAKGTFGYDQLLRAREAREEINLAFLQWSYEFDQYLRAMEAMDRF